MTTRRFGPVAAVVFVLAAAAAGVIGALIYNNVQDDGMVVGSGAGTEAATAVPPAPSTTPDADSGAGAAAVTQPTVEPVATPTPEPVAEAASDISYELIEAAMAEAAANPVPPVLPGRDRIATELLIADLEATGVDLTGIDLTVYPAGSAPSFVLLSSDDSAPLFATDTTGDTAGGEDFLTQLLASPVLVDFKVENFVLEYSGVDEQGPLVATMLVSVDALRSALATGTDISTELKLQVERP